MFAYELKKGHVPPEQLERLIQQTFAFKRLYYCEENLALHVAYLADEQAHRTSHAYAIADRIAADALPFIPLDELVFQQLNDLFGYSTDAIHDRLQLQPTSRVLFNVQEYRSEAEPVPMHCDGELLDFDVTESGLTIREAIRPERVAVLTLVNDAEGGGTRLFPADGSDSFVVRGEPGDLLVFNNIDFKHGVDRLTGTPKRSDGILRMTIGWRSLADKTWYMNTTQDTLEPVTEETANEILGRWYEHEWPSQWANIKAAQRKAAF